MYRLNVVSIELPRLRDRNDDIIPLANYFISRSGKTSTRISPEVKEILIKHDWDGNIRELENAILGSIALADDMIYPEHLPKSLLAPEVQKAPAVPVHAAVVAAAAEEAKLATLAEMEERYVTAILEKTGGNKQAAARILDIDRKTLIRIAERAKK